MEFFVLFCLLFIFFVFLCCQKDTRIVGTAPYIECGAMIARESVDGGAPIVVADSGLIMDRETQTCVDLPAGVYLVIPYTLGVHLQSRSAPVEFAVSLHAEAAIVTQQVPYNHMLAEAALLAQVKAQGEQSVNEDNGAIVHTLKGSAGVMFAVSLPIGSPFTVSIDFDSSASTGVATLTAMTNKVDVKAGEVHELITESGPHHETRFFSLSDLLLSKQPPDMCLMCWGVPGQVAGITCASRPHR